MSEANSRWRKALGGLLMAVIAGAFAPAGGLSLLPRSKPRASHTASPRKAACMTKISDARTKQVFLSQKPNFMICQVWMTCTLEQILDAHAVIYTATELCRKLERMDALISYMR